MGNIQKKILNLNENDFLTIQNNDSKPNRKVELKKNRSVFQYYVSANNPSLLTDDILPEGTLLEFVSVDVLNSYMNYVDLKCVITERDPEDDERHISISNRYYTHFHEFGTVIHVIAASKEFLWYFCYDIDASFCLIGRVRKTVVPLDKLIKWVKSEKISNRFPVVEIDINNLFGWRSFQ